jgi:integrase
MSVRKRRWKTASGEQREAWIVDYSDSQGDRRHRTFDKKKDADQFKAKTTVEIGDGTHVADAASVTVAEAGRLWVRTVEQAGRERTTVEAYEGQLIRHIEPFIGTIKLTKLSGPMVRAFEDDLLAAGRSPALTKKVMVSLGSLLGDALERGLVGRNVAREMRRRRGSSDHRAEKRAKGKLKIGVDIPSPDEIRKIIGALRGRSRPPLLTAAFTGVRASEIRGLPWGCVDLPNARMHIRQRADRFGDIGQPKSPSGERSIPLPPIVVNTLKEWKLQAADKRDEALVFPDRRGQPQAHTTLMERFQTAQIWAEVTWPVLDKDGNPRMDEDGKPVVKARYSGLHALRHFYASWCINRKRDGGLELPPKMVQYRLGHASIVLTLDTYGHLFPSDDDGTEMAAAEAFLMAPKD